MDRVLVGIGPVTKHTAHAGVAITVEHMMRLNAKLTVEIPLKDGSYSISLQNHLFSYITL